MTPLQNRLYFREWGSVVRICKQQGWPAPDRHELHVKALGHDKSHLVFTEEDLDKVLAEFRAISRPEDLAAQLRLQDQPRKRLLYTIRQLAPEPYWKAVARGKFGTDDETQLDLVQLGQLRLTLIARARARARHKETAALNPY